MNTFKIYLAHPMTGLTGEGVCDYYTNIAFQLDRLGYFVMHPLTAKGNLENVGKIKAHGYKANSLTRDHAIQKRDSWMVRQADVVLVDLLNTTSVSIGCVSELAYASMGGKHTVVVMEEGNIHEHAFIFQESDVLYETLDEAVEYLGKLIKHEL